VTTDFYNPNDLVFIQSRAESDPAVIEEYATMMLDGVEFEPAQGITDGKIYIWDGYHRGEAARRMGKLLAVNTRPGSRDEAEWLALSANQKHGLRRSNADKWRVVMLALKHKEGDKMSDRQIAGHCGVSNTFVGKIRESLSVNGLQIDTRTVTRGGQTYEMSTANIGIRYVGVWQLERGLQAWLEENYVNGLQTQVDALETIKQGSPVGKEFLETLLTKDILPGPRRKADVIRACNNVLEQLKQAAVKIGQAAEIDKILDTVKAEGVDLGGYFYCSNCPKRDVCIIYPFHSSNRIIECLNCGKTYETAQEVQGLFDYQPVRVAELREAHVKYEEARQNALEQRPDLNNFRCCYMMCSANRENRTTVLFNTLICTDCTAQHELDDHGYLRLADGEAERLKAEHQAFMASMRRPQYAITECPGCDTRKIIIEPVEDRVRCDECGRTWEAISEYHAERNKKFAPGGRETPEGFKTPTIGESFTPLTDWKCENCGRRIPTGHTRTMVGVNGQTWQICPNCLPDFKKRAGVKMSRGAGEQGSEFLCPRCQGRIGQLNGVALCLADGCGASWPTKAAYESELEAYLEDLDAPAMTVPEIHTSNLKGVKRYYGAKEYRELLKKRLVGLESLIDEVSTDFLGVIEDYFDRLEAEFSVVAK
jgi:ribosomal protein S27E